MYTDIYMHTHKTVLISPQCELSPGLTLINRNVLLKKGGGGKVWASIRAVGGLIKLMLQKGWLIRERGTKLRIHNTLIGLKM